MEWWDQGTKPLPSIMWHQWVLNHKVWATFLIDLSQLDWMLYFEMLNLWFLHQSVTFVVVAENAEPSCRVIQGPHSQLGMVWLGFGKTKIEMWTEANCERLVFGVFRGVGQGDLVKTVMLGKWHREVTLVALWGMNFSGSCHSEWGADQATWEAFINTERPLALGGTGLGMGWEIQWEVKNEKNPEMEITRRLLKY